MRTITTTPDDVVTIGQGRVPAHNIQMRNGRLHISQYHLVVTEVVIERLMPLGCYIREVYQRDTLDSNVFLCMDTLEEVTLELTKTRSRRKPR